MKTPRATPNADSDHYGLLDALLFPEHLLHDLDKAIEEAGPLPFDLFFEDNDFQFNLLDGGESIKLEDGNPVESPAIALPTESPAMAPTPTQDRDKYTTTSETTDVNENKRPREPASRPPMKNPSRERMKTELRFLRSRVSDLEKECADVREQRERRLQIHDRQWKDASDDQLVKRRRSEIENHQLRKTLAKKLGIAKGLERILQELDKNSLTQQRATKRYRSVGDPEGRLFQRLEDEVMRAYAVVDRVMQESSLRDSAVAQPHQHAVVKNGNDKLFVELVDVKFVPFDLARSRDAFWRVITTRATFQDHEIDLVLITSDTVHVKLSYVWPFRGEEKRMRMVIAMKRFVEDTRMVVVWRAVTSSVAEDDSDTGSAWYQAGSDETGWIVLKEIARIQEAHLEEAFLAAMASHDRDRASCVLQTCSRHVPLWKSAALQADTEAAIGEFTTLMLNTTEQDIANVTSAMENLLHAEALAISVE